MHYTVTLPVSKLVDGKRVRLMPRYEVEAKNLVQAHAIAREQAVRDGCKPLPYRSQIISRP